VLQSLLQRQGPENSEKETAGQAMVHVLQSLQPLARELSITGVLGNDNRERGEGVLRMRALEPGR